MKRALENIKSVQGKMKHNLEKIKSSLDKIKSALDKMKKVQNEIKSTPKLSVRYTGPSI